MRWDARHARAGHGGDARPNGVRAAAGVALALALVGLLACGGAPEGPPPNFVLVVVDTLRADHLTGSEKIPLETPNFDTLRRRSTWFRNAYATASWTIPSLASLFVSQLSSQHRLIRWKAELGPDHVTLAEVLRAAGYRTGGWSANVLIGDDSGFQQGFEVYQVVLAPGTLGGKVPEPFPNAQGDLVRQRALSWLRETGAADPEAPFFAYLHYMEPHTPYRCGGMGDRAAGEEAQLGATAEDASAPGDENRSECGERAKTTATFLNKRLLEGGWSFTPFEREMIRALYAGEVRTMDGELGRLVASLQAEDLWENTWLIVTADHGEQLGERGRYLHGESLDPHEIRVPLLISGPKRQGSIVDTPVSLIDLAPTILGLAGLDVPDSFHGRSLEPALNGEPVPATPVVAELFQRWDRPPLDSLAVVSGSDLIVLETDGGLVRFDAERDPLRLRPRAATRRELSRALGELESSIDLSREPPEEPPRVSPQTRERLRALGYAP
jgi:arylsulfatase A-like enzyme